MHNSSLVFIHIPRSAGTALRLTLYANYEKKIHIDGVRGMEYLSSIPGDELCHYSLIEGHIGFDVSMYLPQQHDYITMLRSPVQRVLSTYRYICQYPQHRLHQYVTSKNMTLEEYIQSKCNIIGIDNGMTRILSGEPGLSSNIKFGCCTEHMLAMAKYNLQHRIKVFGIMERFDESVKIIGRSLGWKNLETTMINKTINYDVNIDDHVSDLIAKYNQYDIELYNFAVDHYLKTHGLS